MKNEAVRTPRSTIIRIVRQATCIARTDMDIAKGSGSAMFKRNMVWETPRNNLQIRSIHRPESSNSTKERQDEEKCSRSEKGG